MVLGNRIKSVYYYCLFYAYLEDYTIRLIGGEFDYEGQLEVYLRGDWQSVCVSGNTTDLSGICNVLGWEYGVRNVSITNYLIITIWKGTNYWVYSRTSLIRTPGDHLNPEFVLTGVICIENALKGTEIVFVLTGNSY